MFHTVTCFPLSLATAGTPAGRVGQAAQVRAAAEHARVGLGLEAVSEDVVLVVGIDEGDHLARQVRPVHGGEQRVGLRLARATDKFKVHAPARVKVGDAGQTGAAAGGGRIAHL